MKSILFFGIYDPGYARNRVLRQAFEQNSFAVTECQVDPSLHRGLRKYIALIKKWRSLPRRDYDLILVCYPGQPVLWLARLLAKRPVIFDSFLSLYDSNVNDRKVYSRFHPRAMYDWFLDWLSVHLAQKVLLDTNAHIEYFTRTFKAKREKFIRVFISADQTVFHPLDIKIPEEPFIAHFHGMFIPLQGLNYIIDAADALRSENIIFQIVGSGQEFKSIKERVEKEALNNVKLIGKEPIEKLPGYIARSHICLGIFGDTDKADRVIPNKVYEYAAMGRAIITADSSSISEVFTDGADVLLCKRADGRSIAEAIKTLKGSPELRHALAIGTLSTFENKLKAKKIGEDLINNLYGRQ